MLTALIPTASTLPNNLLFLFLFPGNIPSWKGPTRIESSAFICSSSHTNSLSSLARLNSLDISRETALILPPWPAGSSTLQEEQSPQFLLPRRFLSLTQHGACAHHRGVWQSCLVQPGLAPELAATPDPSVTRCPRGCGTISKLSSSLIPCGVECHCYPREHTESWKGGEAGGIFLLWSENGLPRK